MSVATTSAWTPFGIRPTNTTDFRAFATPEPLADFYLESFSSGTGMAGIEPRPF
jgi:hypothetical protein